MTSTYEKTCQSAPSILHRVVVLLGTLFPTRMQMGKHKKKIYLEYISFQNFFPTSGSNPFAPFPMTIAPVFVPSGYTGPYAQQIQQYFDQVNTWHSNGFYPLIPSMELGVRSGHPVWQGPMVASSTIAQNEAIMEAELNRDANGDQAHASGGEGEEEPIHDSGEQGPKHDGVFMKAILNWNA